MDLFIDFSDLYGVPAQPSPVSRPGQSSHPGPAQIAGRSPSRGPAGSRHASPARKVRGVSENPPESNGSWASPKGKQRMVTSHVRLDTQHAPGAGKVVSYYQVNSHLSLVCITHEEVMEKQGALIEYKLVTLASQTGDGRTDTQVPQRRTPSREHFKDPRSHRSPAQKERQRCRRRQLTLALALARSIPCSLVASSLHFPVCILVFLHTGCDTKQIELAGGGLCRST